MAAKHKSSGRGISVPVGIAIGAAISIAVVLIGALGIAYLVIRETVPIDGAGIGAMVIITLAAALGASIANMLTKQNRLLVCGVTALVFFLILLSINAIFFDGMYTGIGLTALMVLLGAGVSLLPGMRKKSGKSKVKIPAYR